MHLLALLVPGVGMRGGGPVTVVAGGSVVAGELFVPGAALAEVFTPGAAAGEVFSPGVTGEIVA